ncbi:DUF3168 domain-containing protein [Sporolactobacillus terrae]|uniref:DUF3168 domain-containing protein n=1 Tax=Sporolactobacillus terrae TaxID=269673 RepID=UPI00048E7EEA|nr:DUF3168 domain-containing protein [Sporolactobacillus terrae]
MRTALWELQKALLAKLTAYEPLMNKITGVYDDVPQTLINADGSIKPTAFPYVTITVSSNEDFDTKSSIGENIIFVLHMWSKTMGKKESYDMLNLILAALHTPLSIGGGFSIARYVPNRPTVITDIDGKTKHGILELRYYINN